MVWDLPVLGKSHKPQNRDYSLEKYARDLESVLQLVGDQPAILLGHTMVVVGKSDIATRPAASKFMRAEMPQAELNIIAPGDHMALMERNQQFSEIVRDFCHSLLYQSPKMGR